MANNYIADELVEFIETYEEKFGKLEYGKDGKITKESLTKFVTELQNEMGKYGFEDIAGKELLPYCGGGMLDGEIVKGYEIIASLAEGDTYAYISSSKLPVSVSTRRFMLHTQRRRFSCFAAPLICGQKSKTRPKGLKQMISVHAMLAKLRKSSYRLLIEA